MPSRKRAKGRERKLKQQARETVERSVSQAPPKKGKIKLPEQIFRMIDHPENDKCKHGGFKHNRLQGHPVNAFIMSFIEMVTSKNCNRSVTVQDSMEKTFEKHQEVWKDDGMRKMAIDTMVSIGTEFIIDGHNIIARFGSEAIIYLEKYDGEDTYDSLLSKAIGDVAYILGSKERDVIRFYKKRIPCSCLDKLYSEIKKSQVRGSTCYHCNQTVKPKDLKTCNRCKFAQYCSKECQISAWPSHKELCMELANRHKRANNDVETARSNEGI